MNFTQTFFSKSCSYIPKTVDIFNLDINAKKKMENQKGPHPQRGWSSKGAEVTAKLYKKNILDNANVDENDLKDERVRDGDLNMGSCLSMNNSDLKCLGVL